MELRFERIQSLALYATVCNNTIEHSYIAGVDLDTTNNIVEGNLIFKSLGDGIRVYQPNNHISENIIVQLKYRGIYLGVNGNRTEILHNTLINCTQQSIHIMNASRSIIRYNDFLVNADSIYAKDDGYLNVFERNYWKGFIATNQDHDGVFDIPFDILGEAQNRDRYPVTSANNPIPDILQTTETTTTSTTSSTTDSALSNSTSTDPQPFAFLGIVASGAVAVPILVLILYYRNKA